VTAEPASKYINTHTTATLNAGTSAKQYTDQQVNHANDEQNHTDAQRHDCMQKYRYNLPSQSQSQVARSTALYEEQKALIAETGRLRDVGAAYRTQLGDLAKQYDQEIVQVAENTTDPRTTYGWAELTRRKSELEAELQNLLTQYKPKHPDVLSK